MLTLASFIRSTPPTSLRSYFSTLAAPLPAEIPWDGPAGAIAAPLLRAVDAMDEADRLRVMNDAERVGATRLRARDLRRTRSTAASPR